MKKAWVTVCLWIFSLFMMFFYTINVYAIEDPLKVPNNKFGIHIQDEHDFQDAANLVNSQGGDWGYVTFVIREEERDLKRWQETFNKMRSFHLIPIVRIASNPKEAHWQRGDTDQIDDWVSFLKNLTWVTKNKYVIVGNEPNHASEWGGNVNPEEYSDYLLSFSKELKRASSDFFILPAGLDASAPNGDIYMDEAQFLERMIKKNPKIFDSIDGWTSHSYPNPGFSGSETDTGRGSIRTFEWELETLKRLGVTKNLPVFITETGWVHSVDEDTRSQRINAALSKRWIYAYQSVWNAPNVVAVTPFILNYQSPPFDTFSWKKKEGTFFDFYYEVQSLSKTKGQPSQENKGEIQAIVLPEVITMNGNVYGLAYIKNTGQRIWKVGIPETIEVENGTIEVSPTNPLSDIHPNEIGVVLYRDLSKKSKQSMQNSFEFGTLMAELLNPQVN